jgi:hypothetical protein
MLFLVKYVLVYMSEAFLYAIVFHSPINLQSLSHRLPEFRRGWQNGETAAMREFLRRGRQNGERRLRNSRVFGKTCVSGGTVVFLRP